MRLEIGPSIDSSKVRLDFRKGPDRPKYTPSYEIEKSKADEFVKKYNAQEKTLLKFTTVAIAISAIGAIAATLKKRSLKWIAASLTLGAVSGTVIGVVISSHKKNSLMDKYNVKPFSK